MLLPGVFAQKLLSIIKKSNAKPVSNIDQALQDYCTNQENLVYETIKNIQITIPSGLVIVAGPSGGMTNPEPIVISLADCIIS